MATKVLIGVQARSGSTRLPKKAMALISGKTVLDRVLAACKVSAKYLNASRGCETRLVLLTPKDDELAREFRTRCDVREGPELDVLERYVEAATHYDADYIVRITGDCPLIPSFVISKLVTLAQVNSYDYVSNVDERFRTTLDGADCEVISRDLLHDTWERATVAADREHVTTLIRRSPPEWAKIGFVCNYFDMSHVKLSVDTEEDLERVRQAFESANDKYQRARLQFGQNNIHRI